MNQTRPPLMFTVDTEPDWGFSGHRAVTEMLPRMLALLARRGMKATFFVAAGMLESCREVLAEIGPEHEVGSHGLTHRRFDRMGTDERRRELIESRERLQEAGHRIRGVRAPFFSRPATWVEEVAAAGYDYDASVGCVRPAFSNGPVARNGLPVRGGPVPQIPVSTFRDGLTPLCLTYLRLYAPFATALLPRVPRMIYLHLHEFLPGATATEVHPAIRPLLTRNCGEKAWAVLERFLDRARGEWVTCSEYLEAIR